MSEFGDFPRRTRVCPVVNRLEAYCLGEDETVRGYMERVKAHAAWRKWQAAALAEPWIVPEDEV